MLLSNCHTHTTYCDGKNTAEEMILSAIEKGFYSIGISSHSPMIGGADWTMKISEVALYIDEVNLLKEKYKDKIEVYCGIELDNFHEGTDLDKFDYSIGSVHQFRKNGAFYDVDYTPEMLRKITSEFFDGNWNEMAESYFNTLADFVINTEVDVVGHFDLITKFNEKVKQFSTEDAAYRISAYKAIDRILSAKPDIIFEVNTGAMFRCGNEAPYPEKFILEYLFKKGVKITITGDSHCCEALSFAYDKAVNLCKECGFKTSYILKNGAFLPTEL